MLHNQRLLVVCAMDWRIWSYLIGRLPQRSVLLVICLRDSFHFLLHQHLPFGSHNCSTYMEACTVPCPKAVKALAMVCNGTCESSNAVTPSHLTSIVQWKWHWTESLLVIGQRNCKNKILIPMAKLHISPSKHFVNIWSWFTWQWFWNELWTLSLTTFFWNLSEVCLDFWSLSWCILKHLSGLNEADFEASTLSKSANKPKSREHDDFLQWGDYLCRKDTETKYNHEITTKMIKKHFFSPFYEMDQIFCPHRYHSIIFDFHNSIIFYKWSAKKNKVWESYRKNQQVIILKCNFIRWKIKMGSQRC